MLVLPSDKALRKRREAWLASLGYSPHTLRWRYVGQLLNTARTLFHEFS